MTIHTLNFFNSLSINIVHPKRRRCRLQAAVAGKVIKNGLHVFERGENLLQSGYTSTLFNSIFERHNFFFRIRESIKLRSVSLMRFDMTVILNLIELESIDLRRVDCTLLFL